MTEIFLSVIRISGHHVGGRIAAVELHPFDDGHARGHGLAFFHGDNAIRADSFHCVGNQLADGFIRSGVRGDVGNRLLAVDGLGQLLQAFHGGIRRGGNALLQHHGVCAGGEVAQTFADNRLREQGGGGRAVASDVIGLGGDFLHQLRAHVFKGVFQLNFLGDGHTVIGDKRRAVLLVQHHVATLRAEGDFDGIRQRVHALFKAPASLFAILNLLSHKTYFLSIICGVSLLLHHSQNIALAHNNQLFAVDFDFRAGVLAVNNLLTCILISLPSTLPPGPTARTTAICGFSFAALVRIRPDLVVSSASTFLMTTRSPKGFTVIVSFPPCFSSGC